MRSSKTPMFTHTVYKVYKLYVFFNLKLIKAKNNFLRSYFFQTKGQHLSPFFTYLQKTSDHKDSVLNAAVQIHTVTAAETHNKSPHCTGSTEKMMDPVPVLLSLHMTD